VSDGRAVRLRGVAEHPYTQGQLCPKVNRLLDRVYHPDRLLHPLRRTGSKGAGSFEQISWDEAIESITDRLKDIVDTDGAEAILQYSFAGTQGEIQMGVMADRFFDVLGASDTRRHLCGATSNLGMSDVYGDRIGIDPEDIALARTVILWGTNTLLTNRHLWPTIQRAKTAGATVVVIDPIRTQTAAAPEIDEFLQIRPGSDVALVLGMINVMESENLLDPDWLAANTSGWEELRDSALAMSLEQAATVTGVDANRIEWLARTYSTNRPAAIRTLIGPEHREHGRDIVSSVAMLPAVTGAWRDAGGGLARSTHVYTGSALNFPERLSRRTFNMARLGEVLNDRTLQPPIAALVVHNSNPAVITPGQNRIVRGLGREDLFTVVIEQFMTDTARYADVVLPTTTQIEHRDLMTAWGHMYLALNQPAIEPVGRALPNSEIFRRLAAEMGFADPMFTKTDEGLIRDLLDSGHDWLRGVSYERLEREGWARLNVPSGFRPYVDSAPGTPDGKVRLGPLEYRPGTETPSGSPELARRYPLTMMSRKQHPKFLNANYAIF